MKTEKKLNTIFSKSLSALIMLSAFLSLQSCMQSPSNSRKALIGSNSTAGSKTDNKLPEFKEGNNFIQNGGVVYTSSVNFDLSFGDSLQLRGKDVDSYIRNSGTQTISCLSGRFLSSAKISILAAMPHSVYNFSTRTLEYYYSISPSDEASNKNFCQKTGLISKLDSLYSDLAPIYKISDLCPSENCTSTVYTGQPLELYSQNGTALTQVSTKQLTYVIRNQPNITTPIGQTCVSNSECVAQGYNCCSLGQCVKDLALKPNVDQTSQDYVQALQDILNSPSNIYLYPQYYYICSSPTTQPTSPSTPGNPTIGAALRLKKLQDLYNCTTKIEGEMGICTLTYPNAKQYSATDPSSIYDSGKDDRSFSSTYSNQPISTYIPSLKEELITIQEVSYGEVVLFNYDQIAIEEKLLVDPLIVSSYLTIESLHNDDSASGAKIYITKLPPGTVSSDLVIKYRTDASCVQLNPALGKCEKYYIQGQQKSGDTEALHRRGRVTDHFPGGNNFKLPYYALSGRQIAVEVDGIAQKQDIDWKLNDMSPASVEFFPNNSGGHRVFDGQKVKITFFVDLVAHKVMKSKNEALGQIKTNCHCADLNCGLAPVTNSAGSIVDYACVYPDPDPVIPPMSQKIYLSSKTVPVRYFDLIGSSRNEVNGSTAAQEGRPFSYRKDNLLSPSNIPDKVNTPNVDEDTYEETYVGFNEIYGSLSYSNNSAKPAKEVAVTKGRTYDIYVDNGSYSNCVQCGNDYYSQLNKLFPLTQFGGGLVPLQARTDRFQSNGIRADDMSFGRACLVPATMLPWSHSIASKPEVQRTNRMSAQHFLYANGYQHDWFGFDYGAVIGSFDGVKWFAIGTNRRIKADTNKLFIAVNGVFGDLALENTFVVTINDGSLNPIGSNMITSDLESDAAECQKFHQCSTDNDCATTVGWDYTCSNVNETTTSWPRFDDNAKEIPDSQREDNRLTSILGMSSTGKRCVYRGRGVACTQNYLESAININSTFNQAQSQTQHTCSANNYCQTLTTGGNLNSKFNNRIVRYGKVRTDATVDSFGLGAKVPGRPMEFNATEQIRSEAAKNLNGNKISGICIPGRSPEIDTFVGQNSTSPLDEYTGDKITGIGMSHRKGELSPVKTYLAACSIVDESKNYFYTKGSPTSSNAANDELVWNSGSQAISTNALSIFKSLFNTKGIVLSIFSGNSNPIASQTFTENRCLRAPGASCFSDLDCAPSKMIADKIKTLSADDSTITAILNKYEIKFWQEELVCSQATSKSDSSYRASENRCCREVGKTISIANSDINFPLTNDKVPGIDFGMANSSTTKYRYSRTATVYKEQKRDPTNYPPLKTAKIDQCSTGTCASADALANQYKTFATYAEKTSCTGDWVRNFSNGNHKWSSTRFQKFNPAMFRCLNWLPESGRTCAGLAQDDPECKMIQTLSSSSKGKGVLNFLAKMELMGIPQIAIESKDYFNTSVEGDLSCRSDPSESSSVSNSAYPGGSTAVVGATYKYPDQIYDAAAVAEYQAADGKKLFSAADELNFQSMEKIFRADEVASCLAAGTTMEVGADPNLCCTGFINSQTNKCQLPDFVDVSIYTNRYVSSEAKKLGPNLFDSNGYIKDPSYVAQIACEKKMCASGILAYGILISYLKTPGQETLSQKHFRFLEDSNEADDANGLLTLFKQGLKLNNHAYCFPAGSSASESGDLTIITCGN